MSMCPKIGQASSAESVNQQADIRRRFIKIGALATAALESMDRQS